LKGWLPSVGQIHIAWNGQVRQQLLVPVIRWGVVEVGKWVAVIGLPQYRKRFIHQGVSGPLLLKISHAQLKVHTSPPFVHHLSRNFSIAASD